MKEDHTNKTDPHSYAIPSEARVDSMYLDLNIDFKEQVINGTVAYSFSRIRKDADRIILDIKDIIVQDIWDEEENGLKYSISNPDPVLGSSLVIYLSETTSRFYIRYNTTAESGALQWLRPEQTAGKTHPFLFTQSQAILARTWIPCQDGPGVRFTFSADVTVPPGMMALMSAVNPQEKNESGKYHFVMNQPIPSYLMSLAVGDLVFSPVSPRAGVYAEPTDIERATTEFEDLEKMILAAESLYGPYAWERYDLIVLPPSFPFGGMENPRITYVTPTIIAGDKSLTTLVAHELAHSWSGNLVTNATWDDFWLNEGFTVYFENRIMEVAYGKDYADMLAVLGYRDLIEEIQEMGSSSPDTHLKLKLAGRNPDDGMNNIAYEKGALFLKTVEQTVGRDRFDKFLNEYFRVNSFKSLTTEDFISQLKAGLFSGDDAGFQRLNVESWVYSPSLPDSHFKPEARNFELVDSDFSWFKKGDISELREKLENYSTFDHLHFIGKLKSGTNKQELAILDSLYPYTESKNCEIQCLWFEVGIKNKYSRVYHPTEGFLSGVGRRKFLIPLFKSLISTDEGKIMAKEIYRKSRPGYHYVAQESLDKLLSF